jgi:predicted transcriptional regulator
VPFFFLRVDPAGNVDKRFSAAGFPFARFGGSCPKWIVHRAFETPGITRVQVAQLPDGASFLTVARAIAAPTVNWGEPAPTHVVAIGCDISRAEELVYGDGLDIPKATVGIGLSCRLCGRADCRSRAFPPLEHRLTLDPNEDAQAPWRFKKP